MITPRETICAISTPAGVGGIAVIRISGIDACAITDTIFHTPKRHLKVTEMKGGSAHFGYITDGESIIDEVVVVVFRAPNSYTGEDVVEISCHGSLFIQQEILKLLIKNGCSTAKAGEFTQRAFLNGKMDLSQAEAVADVIAANSKAAHRIALNQMRGGFSEELIRLRTQLLDFTSLIELELDFADHEELEFVDRSELLTLAHTISAKINSLTQSFALGNAIKNGIPVAIVGETNVGKSTLLNQLIGEERAIVSNIHGTTRDVIEDTTTINGVLFRFIDTAGIRQTTDAIETIGIERTYKTIDKAQIVLWVVDASAKGALDTSSITVGNDKKLIVVLNKTDIANNIEVPSTLPSCSIAAKSGTGIDCLKAMLVEASSIDEQLTENVTISNARHYESLMRALSAIERVIEGLNCGISGEFLSQDLRECITHLSEITGQISTDEVLGNIFSKFCIGK